MGERTKTWVQGLFCLVWFLTHPRSLASHPVALHFHCAQLTLSYCSGLFSGKTGSSCGLRDARNAVSDLLQLLVFWRRDKSISTRKPRATGDLGFVFTCGSQPEEPFALLVSRTRGWLVVSVGRSCALSSVRQGTLWETGVSRPHCLALARVCARFIHLPCFSASTWHRRLLPRASSSAPRAHFCQELVAEFGECVWLMQGRIAAQGSQMQGHARRRWETGR